MTELEALGVALDRIYGLDNKPDCPICGFKLAVGHPHCLACDSPFLVSVCGQEGCREMFCNKCQQIHSREHI